LPNGFRSEKNNDGGMPKEEKRKGGTESTPMGEGIQAVRLKVTQRGCF